MKNILPEWLRAGILFPHLNAEVQSAGMHDNNNVDKLK